MYNSEFIVKSMNKVVAPLEPALHQSPLMGKIWKLCIHDRLKMFLWRLASNLLPTKESLPRFANNVDISCSLYGGCVEFVTHLFWDCSFARALWFGCMWGIRSDFIPVHSPMNLVENLLASPPELHIFDKDNFVLYGALILDQIWRSRNALVHERKFPKMDEVVRVLKSCCKEHLVGRLYPLVSVSHSSVTRWIKPLQGCLKINVDAAVGPSSSVIVAVARDWRGIMVFAQSKKVNTFIPLQVEAEALVWRV
jgi:hypothetical protein